MPWYGQQSLLHPFGTTTSHGVEYVLQSREKASRTVHKDRGGTPRDATGDGGTDQKGSDRELASLCVGEPSFGRECASDHSGTQRSTYGCANMIESSICFLSGVGWRTERQLW